MSTASDTARRWLEHNGWTEPTMTVSVPRRQGFRIAWRILRTTIGSYLGRSPNIDFIVGRDQ